MQRRLRLRRPADFVLLHRQGHRWHHPLVTLLTRANGQQISRFGFVASKRVGKATDRNRAKRLLREAVRGEVEKVESGWDCLFIAHEKTAQAHISEVESAVMQLLNQAKLLKDPLE